MKVRIIGAGLAGCEAAWQLAERGIEVDLVEQKPLARTPAQFSEKFCELVCSNSLRGADLANAVGLLKEELRRAGSLVLRVADATRVPAGGALAVDRELFSQQVTEAIRQHPRIRVHAEVVTRVPSATPDAPVVLATGPLTGDALATDLARVLGSEHLAYYDAIAPIVSADSVDWTKVFKQSRWGKGEKVSESKEEAAEGEEPSMMDQKKEGDAGGDDAYGNCPFTKEEYHAFLEALLSAEKVEPRSFEKAKYFEGCLPIEVMASRGPMTLAFGPMKPAGLTDPRTGRWPFAVVQLRPEDHAATAYNLVGFQTRMTYPEQARVFRMIPGLENAEFLRFGSIHRNTFVNSPDVLDAHLQVKSCPGLYLAGQITGVEGYVESCGSGFLCGVLLAQRLKGEPLVLPPSNTALGGLMTHVGRPGQPFQPSNITWACLPPHPNRRLQKREKYRALAEQALASLQSWLEGPLA